MGTPMTVVQLDDDFRPVPLGGYVDAIPASDLQGHDFTGRHVEKVYRHPTGRFLHVLLAATTPNVFLVIVVDEPAQSIHGHCVLDLNKEYGLSQERIVAGWDAVAANSPRPPLCGLRPRAVGWTWPPPAVGRMRWVAMAAVGGCEPSAASIVERRPDPTGYWRHAHLTALLPGQLSGPDR